jgi:hypothetical protein
MNPSAIVLLVLLVLGLMFNGRDLIKRNISRVPVLVRGKRWSR